MINLYYDTRTDGRCRVQGRDSSLFKPSASEINMYQRHLDEVLADSGPKADDDLLYPLMFFSVWMVGQQMVCGKGYDRVSKVWLSFTKYIHRFCMRDFSEHSWPVKRALTLVIFWDNGDVNIFSQFHFWLFSRSVSRWLFWTKWDLTEICFSLLRKADDTDALTTSRRNLLDLSPTLSEAASAIIDVSCSEMCIYGLWYLSVGALVLGISEQSRCISILA